MALLTSTSLLPWGSRVHDDDCGGTLFHRGLPPNNPFTIKSKFRWFQGGKSQNLNAFGDSIEKDDQALKKSSIASCLEEPQEYRACTRRQMYRLQSFERENPMVPSTQRRFLFIRSNFLLQMSPTTSHICGLSRHSNTVPFATRGPKELHVTCTELLSEDGLLKKQGLQAWEPEMKDNDLEGLLCSTLPTHPKLYRGQLYNGIRYVILPNKVPPNRWTRGHRFENMNCRA